MKEFITKNKIKKLFIIIFWIFVWQILSMIFKGEILLVSPFKVIKTTLENLTLLSFYINIFITIFKILLGFILALFLGIILAIMSYNFEIFKSFIDIPMLVLKSVPVVSFIIILLLVFKSENLPIIISFIMVLPIIYLNVYEGLNNVDKKLLKMAFIYKVSLKNKVKYIYLDSLKPFLYSSISLSTGLAFKSGLAAEVIALPNYGIGTMLYNSKIYLDADNLFSYTIVAVFLAYIFEKGIKYICGRVLK